MFGSKVKVIKWAWDLISVCTQCDWFLMPRPTVPYPAFHLVRAELAASTICPCCSARRVYVKARYVFVNRVNWFGTKVLKIELERVDETIPTDEERIAKAIQHHARKPVPAQ